MFWVGQRVVCVRDDWFYENGETVAKKGEVYTIRSKVVCLGISSGLALRFREIVNKPGEYTVDVFGTTVFDEPGFDSASFRPLVETPDEDEVHRVVEAHFGHYLRQPDLVE